MQLATRAANVCESDGLFAIPVGLRRNDGEITEDEELWQHVLSYRDAKHDFTMFVRNRAEAEDCYRRSKALE